MYHTVYLCTLDWLLGTNQSQTNKFRKMSQRVHEKCPCVKRQRQTAATVVVSVGVWVLFCHRLAVSSSFSDCKQVFRKHTDKVQHVLPCFRDENCLLEIPNTRSLTQYHYFCRLGPHQFYHFQVGKLSFGIFRRTIKSKPHNLMTMSGALLPSAVLGQVWLCVCQSWLCFTKVMSKYVWSMLFLSFIL